MRRAVAALLGVLPFDDRGRRAIDETLLDWAHEAALVPAGWRRHLVGLLALAGLARAVSGAIAFDVVHIPYGWLCRRLLLVGLVPFLLLTVNPILNFVVRVNVPSGTMVELVAFLLPQGLGAVLPLALFWTVAYPPSGQRLPILGLALVACIASLAILGWLVPWANQEFRLLAFSVFSGGDVESARWALRRGPNELWPSELFTQALADPGGRQFRTLVTKLGLVLVAGALVVLGGATSYVPRARRRHWMWLVPLACSAGFVLAGNWSFLCMSAAALAAALSIRRRAALPQYSPS